MSFNSLDVELLKGVAEPSIALIITQNEEGEVIDARLAELSEAMILLRSATEDKAKREEQPARDKGAWWKPIEK